MRTLSRILTVALLALALVVVAQLAGLTPNWLALPLSSLTDRAHLLWLSDAQPAREVSPEQLPQYARTVAGNENFQDDFVRMVFSDQEGPNRYSGRVTKWGKRRVRVALLNDGGPGMSAYVRTLVERLNRMQGATTFMMVDGETADITLRFLPKAAYKRRVSLTSVGHCETRFIATTGRMMQARILIDAETLPSQRARRPVVIHELTHALGFRGHLHDPSAVDDRVLYVTPAVDRWAADDSAAIRILYSTTMKSGGNVTDVRRGLWRIAAAAATKKR